MIRVEVTEADIRTGKPKDCFLCPGVLALERATKQDCQMIERDGVLYVVVGWRWRPAPMKLRLFVWDFDGVDPADVSDRLGDDLAPFAFEIPDLDSSEWQEECGACEKLFDQDELDEDGHCQRCRMSVPV